MGKEFPGELKTFDKGGGEGLKLKIVNKK